MPPLSRQKRLEMIADGIMRDVNHTWKHTVLPTEVTTLGRRFSRRAFKLGITVTDVLHALEGENKLKLLRTPVGKGWVIGRVQWDALAPVIRDVAVHRLDKLVSLRKSLATDRRLTPEQIQTVSAELAIYQRFD